MKIDIPSDRVIYNEGKLIRIKNYSQIYSSVYDFLTRHIRFRMWLTVDHDLDISILSWCHMDGGFLRQMVLDGAIIYDEFDYYPILTLNKKVPTLRRDQCFYNGNPDQIYMNVPGYPSNTYTCITNPSYFTILRKECKTISLQKMKEIYDSLPSIFDDLFYDIIIKYDKG